MTLDCEHGQLARSCEICQLVRERDEARAIVELGRAWLKAYDANLGSAFRVSREECGRLADNYQKAREAFRAALAKGAGE